MKKSLAPKPDKHAKETKHKKGKGRPQYFQATSFSTISPTSGARILLANYDEATGIGNITVRILRLSPGVASIYCRVDVGDF